MREKIMKFKNLVERISDNAEIIFNPSPEELRELAKKEDEVTASGSVCYHTKLKGRSAKYTEVLEKGMNEWHEELLDKVAQFVKGKKITRFVAGHMSLQIMPTYHTCGERCFLSSLR
jgi:hypothetical protein